jgi:dolichol-phosphate mannosyltransferase
MLDRYLVVIPTYNEVLSITFLVRSILKADPRLDVLIVDDSSPDGTASVIKTEFLSDKRVALLIRKQKMGLGSAYIEGFKWAVENNYPYVMEMDADFSHKPDYIPYFLTAISDADLVLGSRYIRGGGVVNWGLGRLLLSRGGSFYSRLLLNVPVRDLTGGFKCFRTSALKQINLDKIKSSGYSFQIEMTYLLHLLNKKIRDIPIVFEDRRVGKSKLSRSEVIRALLTVPRLRLLGKRHPALKK